MKKRVLIILAVVMLMFSMVACKGGSGESDVIGKWELTKMSGEGMEFDKETLKSMGMVMTVELKEGGKAVISMTGEDDEEVSWEKKDGNVIIGDEGEKMEFKVDGKTMSGEQEGFKVELEKVK